VEQCVKLVATTVVRESTRGKQKTGWIYEVDWDAQKIVRKLPVEEPRYPSSDDNPRGGVRGGRGAAVTDRGVVVANYDTLVTYDRDWAVLDSLSHPLFVGLHEIEWDGCNIWVAATGIDALLRVGARGEVEVAWDPHTSRFKSSYRLRPRSGPMDGSVDYRLPEAPLVDQCHLNGIAVCGDSLVVNCGLVRRRKSAASRLGVRVQSELCGGRRPKGTSSHSGRSVVVELGEGGVPKVLLELETQDFPSHNGQLLNRSRIAVNDSTHNTLRIFSADDRRPLQEVMIEGTWLRGLEPVDGERVFVGTAPASIVLVDVERGEVERTVRLSDDPNEAVHGLTLVP
jgi:hypothetical protein